MLRPTVSFSVILTGILVVVMCGLAPVKAQPLLPDDFALGREAYEARDFETARRLWLPLANSGDLRAQFAMGTLYNEGAGVGQDFAMSTYWFRLAAEQGLPAAQYNLGNAYRHGFGVVQDDLEAISWWRKADEKGLASATFNIGTQYYYGRGVPEDQAEAFRWYRKAASLGHLEASRMFAGDSSMERMQAAVDTPPVDTQSQARGVDYDALSVALETEARLPVTVDDSQLAAVESESTLSSVEAITQPVTEVAESHAVMLEVDPPAAATEPQSEAARTPITELANNKQSVLHGSDWLLQQDPTHFTLQLTAMTEEARVSRFINRHQLKGEMAYFRFERDGRPFFALVYGVFADRSDASSAMNDLPKGVRDGTPWPRDFGGIQTLMQISDR